MVRRQFDGVHRKLFALTSSLKCLINQLSQPEFFNVSHSREDYQEYGPSLVRRFSVFGSAA